jgi:PadR family transcriptional regulator PadR
MPPGGRRMRRGRRGGGGGGPTPILGVIEPALLLLLRKGPTHGYGLISSLPEIGLGDYPIDPSTIYRVLRDLEARGLVVSRWDSEATSGPPRRVYELTPACGAYLAEWMTDLRATHQVLNRLLGVYDDAAEKSQRRT